MPKGPDMDAALVAQAKAGDFTAFDALVRRHEQRVFALAMRIVRLREDAEEVVQDTFLSAMESLEGFRGDSSFLTWILRIATNHALQVLRKGRRSRTISLDAPVGDQDQSFPHPDFIARWRDNPERLAGQRETRQLLDKALDALDEKHRAVFVLRDVEGLSTQDTAQTLGLSESNVKVRLLRARLKLREMLTQTLGDPQQQLTPSHQHE